MLSQICILGLYVLGVVASNLEPQQGTGLPMNSSFLNLISNAPNQTNNSAISSLSLQSLTPSFSNQSNLGRGSYQCDKGNYGQPNRESCRDAYKQLSSDPDDVKFGDRTAPGNIDIRLPIRYSSGTLASMQDLTRQKIQLIAGIQLISNMYSGWNLHH